MWVCPVGTLTDSYTVLHWIFTTVLWHTLGRSCYFYVWNILVAFHCTWNKTEIVWCAKPYLIWFLPPFPSWSLITLLPIQCAQPLCLCFLFYGPHPKDLPAYNSNFSLNVISETFSSHLIKSSHPNTITTSYINSFHRNDHLLVFSYLQKSICRLSVCLSIYNHLSISFLPRM